MNLLLLPIAGAASALTYAATYHALKNFTTIESPRLVAVCIALLSGLGLLSLGNGLITLILIPFATLGLSLLAFALFRWLVRSGAWREIQNIFEDNITSFQPRRPPAPMPPTGAKKRASGHLPETPQTKE